MLLHKTHDEAVIFRINVQLRVIPTPTGESPQMLRQEILATNDKGIE